MRQLFTRTPAPRRYGAVLSAAMISVGIASLFLNPVTVGDSLAAAAETAGNFSTETAGATTPASSPAPSAVEVGDINSNADSGTGNGTDSGSGSDADSGAESDAESDADQAPEDDAPSVDSGIAVGTSEEGPTTPTGDPGVGTVDNGNSADPEEPAGTTAPQTPAAEETSAAPATPAAVETSVAPGTSAAPTTSVTPATSAARATSTEETTTSTTHREVGGIMNWRPGDRARSGGGEPDQSAEPAPQVSAEPTPPPAPNPPSAAPAPQVSAVPTPPPPANPPSVATAPERGRPEVGAVAGREENGPAEALARTGVNLDTLLWLSVIVLLIGGAVVFVDRL